MSPTSKVLFPLKAAWEQLAALHILLQQKMSKFSKILFPAKAGCEFLATWNFLLCTSGVSQRVAHNVERIGDGLVIRVPSARTTVDWKFEVENMKKRTTKNIQPDPLLNSERQTIDPTSRQTITNTNVTCRFYVSAIERLKEVAL